MSDYEVLKETKVSYEYIRDILENADEDIVSTEISFKLQESLNALEEIYSNVYEKMKNDEIESKKLNTDLECPHCTNNVVISDLINYAYLCNDCDENFYLGEGDLGEEWYFAKNMFSLHQNFTIEIWETEWHRDAGEGFIYDKKFSDYETAIIEARKLFYDYNYASIEVLNNDGEPVYCHDDESEDFYFKENKLSRVDETIVKKYIDNWANKKDQSFKGNKLYCKDNDIFIGVNNSTNNCWVEEFNSEKDVQYWLLGKNLESDVDYEI